MSSYRYTSSGAMTLLNSVSPRRGGNFLGIALHPTHTFIYAATPSPTLGSNYMSAYKYSGSTGALSFQRLVANGGRATCWISVNAAGTRFYDSETVSNTVSVYDISTANKPVFQQQIALLTGGTPVNLKVDPTQGFLYVLQDKGVKQISNTNAVQARLIIATINADFVVNALHDTELRRILQSADMATAGEKRGLVTIGRVASEDPGMRACAAWLKTIVKEVPARWIPAGDLYWRAV